MSCRAQKHGFSNGACLPRFFMLWSSVFCMLVGGHIVGYRFLLEAPGFRSFSLCVSKIPIGWIGFADFIFDSLFQFACVEKHGEATTVEADRCCCGQEAQHLLEEQLPTASQEDQNSRRISRKVCGRFAEAPWSLHRLRRSETLLSFLT